MFFYRCTKKCGENFPPLHYPDNFLFDSCYTGYHWFLIMPGTLCWRAAHLYQSDGSTSTLYIRFWRPFLKHQSNCLLQLLNGQTLFNILSNIFCASCSLEHLQTGLQTTLSLFPLFQGNITMQTRMQMYVVLSPLLMTVFGANKEI